MKPQYDELLDRLITEETGWDSPEVQAARKASAEFAREADALRNTLKALQAHVAEFPEDLLHEPAAVEQAFGFAPQATDESGDHLSGVLPSGASRKKDVHVAAPGIHTPGIQDVRKAQALNAAYSDPSDAYRRGGDRRRWALAIFGPAAAALLGWVILSQSRPSQPGFDPQDGERNFLSGESVDLQFEANEFHSIKLPARIMEHDDCLIQVFAPSEDSFFGKELFQVVSESKPEILLDENQRRLLKPYAEAHLMVQVTTARTQKLLRGVWKRHQTPE